MVLGRGLRRGAHVLAGLLPVGDERSVGFGSDSEFAHAVADVLQAVGLGDHAARWPWRRGGAGELEVAAAGLGVELASKGV